jgi:superfamily II DNA/RNA helicase
VLLCTESGGEGRNVQFCNTLINFDVPWNPMAIEQRIGRIDRIGQQREVFVFNLVTRGTLEEQVLHLLDEKIRRGVRRWQGSPSCLQGAPPRLFSARAPAKFDERVFGDLGIIMRMDN